MAGNSRRRRKTSKKTKVKSRSSLKRSKNEVTISDLNDDCLLQILHELSMDDLLNIAQTSSRFKELAKFVFPKLWFCPSDVRKIYDMYSDLEANAIVQNIRKLEIKTRPDPDDKWPQLIKKISNNCTKLQKLILRDRFCEFVDRDVIIKLCQNITILHLDWENKEDSFIKEILLKNNGQLKELTIHCSSISGATTFLEDIRNLEQLYLDYPSTLFNQNSVIEFLDNNCDSLEFFYIRTKRPLFNETIISKIVSKLHNLKTICIYHHENEIDISPIARMSTLKGIEVTFDGIPSQAIKTFFDDLAKTNVVESLYFEMRGWSETEGPTRKMNSLKYLTLDPWGEDDDDLRNFHFENLPELEELSISFLEPKMIVYAIMNILRNLPKLKTLDLRGFDCLTKNHCLVLEQFLAEQNRHLILRVSDYIFDKVMDNPGDFKFLRVQINGILILKYFHHN